MQFELFKNGDLLLPIVRTDAPVRKGVGIDVPVPFREASHCVDAALRALECIVHFITPGLHAIRELIWVSKQPFGLGISAAGTWTQTTAVALLVVFLPPIVQIEILITDSWQPGCYVPAPVNYNLDKWRDHSEYRILLQNYSMLNRFIVGAGTGAVLLTPASG
eukprot:COSAG01_NODE_30440_length_616_cov_0.651838_1_plen_163_part_00